MRVLLLEGEPGASCEAALDLAAAGHTVARCHSRDEPAFPCRGLTDDACPLDDGDVDAVVVVRGVEVLGGPDRDSGEDGARCALRRHVPLVLAGEPARSVRTVETAAHAPLRRHADTARIAFAAVLEAHGLDSRLADAVVTRDGGQLHVRLTPSGPVPTAVLEIASVRVAGAIRAVDRHPRIIDVVTAAG
jgi:hypothetical protein